MAAASSEVHGPSRFSRQSLQSSRAILLLQLAGWSAYGLSTFLTLLPTIPPGQRLPMLASKLARAAVGCLASFLLLALYRRLRERRMPRPAFAVIAVGACTVLGVAWLALYRGLIAPSLLASPPPFAAELFARASLDMVFVLIAWSGVYLTVVAWREVHTEQQRTLEATQLAQVAQFQMLAYQLNPHFLFNALNSIRSMIAEDPGRAKHMVTEFSTFLRYTLAADPGRRVTIAEEFEMVSGYLAIESIRFERRLDASTDLHADVADTLIPGFIVHPLVENAIKYGRGSATEPLRVRVAAVRDGDDRVRIVVRNSGALRPADEPRQGSGVGWTNIRQRLALLYGADARLDVLEDDGWVVASIDVPAAQLALAHA